mmetsp:Transcript_44470/g.60321  ORF Transcript_44470/g.60321 Transcript_44470/m.60321 type:complete len:258 (-) Transcript_44470:349-1122(-)
MEGVVTITSDNNSAVTFAPLVNLRPDRVRETRSHVGNSEGESVLEAIGKSGLLEGAIVKILGYSVLEDAVGLVTLLVIVNKKFFGTVTVDISVLSKVHIKNGRIINNTGRNKGTINSGNSGNREDLVEEFGTEDNNFVLVLAHLNHINTYISHVTDNVFSPVFGLKTTFWVFEPKEFTLTGLGVGTSSQEIFTTITVEINPETHVVIEALLLGESVSVYSLSNIVGVNLNNVDTTIALTWYEETIRYNNGALTFEDI